jgi:hypothetical protein
MDQLSIYKEYIRQILYGVSCTKAGYPPDSDGFKLAKIHS